jgi:hypothetical protein
MNRTPPKKASPPPASKKASIVKDTAKIKPSIPMLDYGTPEDINIPSDSFDGFIRCFFGAKGVGKSTLAAQCPKNFTIMLEPQRRNLRIWQANLQKHSAMEIIKGAPDAWELIVNTTQMWVQDENIQTLTFDSVDIAYECCYHHVCAECGVESPSKAGKGGSDIWNQIRDEWASYFSILAESRLAINLLSHLKTKENEELDGGKINRKSPSCSPACLLHIKQAADFVFFYGKVAGNKRAIQLRDEDGGTECAAGAEARFYQPDGKPIYYLEMPDLLDKETGYDRLCKAFKNECWDMYTPESERKKSSPPPTIRRGPPGPKKT